jgi:hypothetical protein
MRFEVGQTVVYPHHGAAQIVEVADRTLRGETKVYLQLKVSQTELTIWCLPTMLTWSVFATLSTLPRETGRRRFAGRVH